MRLAAIFVSTLAVFAFQCGGQIDEGCPSTPDQSCVQEGKACTFPATICGTQTTETCTCKSGAFACPEYFCPDNQCPTDVEQGASCTSKGLECPSMVTSDCSDLTTTCTCDGNQFDCPIPDCPPPMCPVPSSIVAGAPCDVDLGQQCIGQDGPCTCQVDWLCAVAVDAGPPIDAGTSD